MMILLLPNKLFSQFQNMGVFADTLKYGWHTPFDRYQYRENLFIRNSLIENYERERINVAGNMINSLILPGTGHFHTGNYLRGLILLGGQVFVAGATVHFYSNGKSLYEEYERANQISEINRLYDEASDSFMQASLLAGAFVALWVYNVFDTYIITKEYNRRLWESHVRNDGRIQMSPNGVTYRFC
jgi:hypothetical protein